MKILLLFLCCSFSLWAAEYLERNLTTGLLDDSYSTASDKNRHTLLAHVNGDLSKATALVNFEYIYARKLEFCWLEFLISKNTGELSSYSNISSTKSASFLSGGAGISYRSQFIGSIFSSDKVFDTVSAFVVYHLFEETFQNQSYRGQGIKVDYGIHYRSSSKFHYGIRFSYNLATVMREALVDSETKDDRSLTLHWTSLAVELGYYF